MVVNRRTYISNCLVVFLAYYRKHVDRLHKKYARDWSYKIIFSDNMPSPPFINFWSKWAIGNQKYIYREMKHTVYSKKKKIDVIQISDQMETHHKFRQLTELDGKCIPQPKTGRRDFNNYGLQCLRILSSFLMRFFFLIILRAEVYFRHLATAHLHL